MGRIPRPSPALVVATISLIVAIGGTAFALPGKFTVGRDDLKDGSIGARAIGRVSLDITSSVITTDPVSDDGAFTETTGTISCPSKAPFAFDPSVTGLGPLAYEARRTTFANRWGGPGSFRIVLTSDEGPGAIHALKVNCLPSR